MHRFTSYVRRPVKRQGAEQYLMITLLSFAASVTLTRLFLWVTGYPQLGGGELHIAHVLWGGLLLFFASILPLIVANRWAYLLGAVLSGGGVGLFIDEVGKFITAENDYFYPLAAPIIYAFFLLVVLLYLRVRRPPSRGPRAELYRAFDAMEEVLEHDLDPGERQELTERLENVAQQTDYPDLARLAEGLLDFISHDGLSLVEVRSTLWNRWLERIQHFEATWINRSRFRAILAGWLLALGLVGLVNMAMALPIGPSPNTLERILIDMIQHGRLTSIRGLNWFAARLALEASVGVILLIGAGLLIARKDELGLAFGFLGLLLSLTTVNLLVFYFEQFSAIVTASVQFGLLITIAYYRQRYLNKPSGPPGIAQETEPAWPGQSGLKPGASKDE